MDGSNILEAVKLMIVGMSTVFVVLGLVIACGNMLIKFVNKFCPEEEVAKVPASSPVRTTASVNADVQAVIEAAVDKAFGGKAMVDKIEKL